MSDKPATPAPAPAKAEDNGVVTPPVVTPESKVVAEPTKTEPNTTEKTVVNDGEKPSAESNSPAKSVVPEKYDLKLPEKSLLPESAIEDISSYAKEKGLSNEQAQELVNDRNNAITGFVEREQAKLKDMSNKWAEEVAKDKEIGGDALPKNAELAKRVLEKFFPEDVRKFLNDSGFGNHPGLVRGFVRLAKQMSEDQLVIPKSEPLQKKPIEQVFYPSSTEAA